MGEDWLAYLVVVLLFLVFYIVREKWWENRAKNAPPVFSREPDLERARRLFNLAEEKLGSIGLTDLMLRDFEFQTRLTAEQCRSAASVQTQLQSMLIEMLPHLHLMPNVRLLVTEDHSEMRSGGLGEYEIGRAHV